MEITGEGVYSFTMMFLQMWRITEKVPEDYEKYRPDPASPALAQSDGFVLPYGDSPLDGEPVGASVYLDIIQKAKNYVHITTPYLVLDYELTNSLCRAAKAGVDVKIITPHIPDRWYMYVVAWDFYRELIAAGVGIYEYTPGFIHCKAFVSDDETAVVGSINLDYRSLYLHFECACWFYRSRVVAEVEEDFTETLAKCRQITLKDWQNLPWYKSSSASCSAFSPPSCNPPVPRCHSPKAGIHIASVPAAPARLLRKRIKEGRTALKVRPSFMEYKRRRRRKSKLTAGFSDGSRARRGPSPTEPRRCSSPRGAPSDPGPPGQSGVVGA